MERIDPVNIPNVNFSLEVNDEKRTELFKQQRLERGFDDTETWNLDLTISRFILPRLKVFKEKTIGYPPELTFEEWQDIIQKMIDYFEAKSNEDNFLEDIDSEGFDLFCKYFESLWW